MPKGAQIGPNASVTFATGVIQFKCLRFSVLFLNNILFDKSQYMLRKYIVEEGSDINL